MISRIIRFIETDIWALHLEDLRPFQAFFIRSLRMILFALRKFYKDGCPARASALTFYSLLSVVPVVAVLFAVGKGFGLERMIETQVMKFAEMGNWPPEIVDKSYQFFPNPTWTDQWRGDCRNWGSLPLLDGHLNPGECGGIIQLYLGGPEIEDPHAEVQ